DHNRQKSVIYSKHNPTLERNFPRIELEDFRSRKESQVTLQFLTPAQIKIKGKIQHQPTFEQLIRGVLRRYQSLKHFHSDEPREFFEVDLQEAARVKVANDDVRSDGFVRYSNRQKRAIAMQGFTGSITYQGNLAPFLPWLQVGELIHVGKGAVFGMGWYRILTHAQ
ncbi:MAG TPA: CRISPR system precrRNA processing endoribonuclease RAMP protein Cas6, partial [Calditrichia bacterium]|nr:CRISPR system precrRNA processing endoribonuclease RAMP protein Cas6 [Calditrichia bacterium]